MQANAAGKDKEFSYTLAIYESVSKPGKKTQPALEQIHERAGNWLGNGILPMKDL